ncbi:MAG: PD-(D/E)XK nuclease family protein, partial [Patescibacteria group bacterium]|nr:PD-(D/E)XK nuclease family protein [Patescibacteria group bacterium]
VDHLLKNEFDLLRKKGQRNLLMKEFDVNAIPFNHPDFYKWRDDENHFIGASIVHKPTNLEICGIIDDIWINPKGEIHIVDYKSTSTAKEITLEDEYKSNYKKQVEWYQWIFRKKQFKVSNTAYFVFANGLKGERVFDGKLEFKLKIIPHEGDDSWVEKTIYKIKNCLDSETIPSSNENCIFCSYRKLIKNYEKT